MTFEQYQVSSFLVTGYCNQDTPRATVTKLAESMINLSTADMVRLITAHINNAAEYNMQDAHFSANVLSILIRGAL